MKSPCVAAWRLGVDRQWDGKSLQSPGTSECPNDLEIFSNRNIENAPNDSKISNYWKYHRLFMFSSFPTLLNRILSLRIGIENGLGRQILPLPSQEKHSPHQPQEIRGPGECHESKLLDGQNVNVLRPSHPCQRSCPSSPKTCSSQPRFAFYEDGADDPDSAIWAALASVTFFISPCLPFCCAHQSATKRSVRGSRVQGALTLHFANRNSVWPLLSATNLCSSLRLRRTTRAATDRYLL